MLTDRFPSRVGSILAKALLCLPHSAASSPSTVQAACKEFYRRFLESPNFATWLERRRQAGPQEHPPCT